MHSVGKSPTFKPQLLQKTICKRYIAKKAPNYQDTLLKTQDDQSGAQQYQ